MQRPYSHRLLLLPIALLALTLILAGCGGRSQPADDGMTSRGQSRNGQGVGKQEGDGVPGMERFHGAPIPEEYAGLTNPVTADQASLDAGRQTYSILCASCHGDDGLGEGAAGQALNPPPAPVARTSRMVSDAYLFWRISEGGAAFDSAMPPWKDVLDEQQRWDVINYLHRMEEQ